MMRSVVICVDDDKWLIGVLSGLLNDWVGKNYQIEKALSGQEALEIIDECLEEGKDISLVISDYIMPGMKGDELLEQVKLKTPATRRIMLTGFAAIEGIANAINKAGIYRFMSKPWDNKDMMLTVLQAIRSFEQDKQTERLAQSHKELHLRFQEQAANLQVSFKKLVEAMAYAVELRNGDANGHASRVAGYASKIATELNLSEETKNAIITAAMLHDIGKLCLNDEEFDALRGNGCYTKKEAALRQAEFAKRIISDMGPGIANGIIYHTERVDGMGPYGLKAEKIPVEARIIGLCNYYDIMSSVSPTDAPMDILRIISPDKDKIFDGILFSILMKVVS